MKIENILKTRLSYQERFYYSDVNETDLQSILWDIRSDKYFEFTEMLRGYYRAGNKEKYSLNKRNLPVAIFGGTFKNGRTKEHMLRYNSLIVLDIDKLGKDEMKNVKINLNNDIYVFTFWESPSQDGIKGLVHLNYKFDIFEHGIDNSHKMAFRQLVKYFQEKHNIELDTSGSDFTRLCFLSCDKSLALKNELVSFDIEYIPEEIQNKARINAVKTINQTTHKDILNNPFGKNNPNQRKVIRDIISYLTKNQLSITNSYENWLRVAFAICNSFTFEVGIKYFLELCRLDKEKFNEIECRNLLTNCYEYSRGEISFNSIIHLATEKGFKYKNIIAKST